MKYQILSEGSALAQLMKTKIPTIVAIYRAVFQSGLLSKELSEEMKSSCLWFFSSSRPKKSCIRSPMITEKAMAPSALANPILAPRTLAVRMMARMLIAGPE